MKPIVISGLLHSGTSIIRDLILDSTNLTVANGGDEDYFLREINGAYDILNRYQDSTFSSVLQQTYRYKFFLLKCLILNKISLSKYLRMLKYINRSENYYRRLKKHSNINEKIDVIKSFYLDNNIYLDSVNYDMDPIILKSIFSHVNFIIPIRDVYSQFYEIEKSDFFFGPYKYLNEFMVGRYKNNFLRRELFANLMKMRVLNLFEFISESNFIFVDVNKIFKDDSYRVEFLNKLKISPPKFYPILNIERYRDWVDGADEYRSKLSKMGYDMKLISILDDLTMDINRLCI